jgi:PAS domain S-box-containing protein
MSHQCSKSRPALGVSEPVPGDASVDPASTRETHADCRRDSLIDALPALAWTAKPDGAAEYFNRRWLDYTGLPRSEALAWGWLIAIHPEDRAGLVASWRELPASADALEVEARMRRSDGEYRWFLIRANAIRDETGAVRQWCGTNIDVEDRRRADQAVRASEQRDIDELKQSEVAARSGEHRVRLIVDSVPGMLFTTTTDGEVEFVNRRLLDYFERSLEELQAWKQADAIHPDDLPRTIEEVRRGVSSGQAYELEHRMRRADGTYRWFHYSAAPLRDAHGQISRWYGMLTDIDDLKRADEALRSTQMRLSRATHLAALSELSASIAHEINQPLAAVVTNASACLRWLSATPPNMEQAALSAARIIRDGNGAAEVITRMRSLFKRASPLKRLLDLNETIREVCDLIAEDARTRGIQVQTTLQLDLPRVSADRVHIQQVIANIARNAMEAVESVARPRELVIVSRSTPEEVVVSIIDNGEGVGESDLLFEPLYTTKPNGMGMGLAICRSIIAAHGGRLWVQRNPSHGATFSFALLSSDARA